MPDRLRAGRDLLRRRAGSLRQPLCSVQQPVWRDSVLNRRLRRLRSMWFGGHVQQPGSGWCEPGGRRTAAGC